MKLPFSHTELELPFSKQDTLSKSFDEAYSDWKDHPSPAANSRILTAMDPMIDRAISANVPSSNPILKSHARRIALDSLASFNPARSRIQTHLTHQFQQLKRFSRRQTEPLQIPERDYYNSIHLRQAGQQLEDELGREPTLTELADRTSMSAQKIRNIRRGVYSLPEGSLHVDEETGEPVSPAVQSLPDDRLVLELMMDDLVPIDQKILEWTLGLNGQPKLGNIEIAARLNRSPGLISQRKRQLQSQMDELGSAGLFGG